MNALASILGRRPEDYRVVRYGTFEDRRDWTEIVDYLRAHGFTV